VRPQLSHGQVKVMLKRWFMEDGMAMDVWEENPQVVEWLINQLDENSTKSVVKENIHCLRRDSVVNQANFILQVCHVRVT